MQRSKKATITAKRRATQKALRRRGISTAVRSRRRNHKQRGGSQMSRISRNVAAASKESQKHPIGNYFYSPKEENLLEGYAMIIGQRFEYGSGISNTAAKTAEILRERKAAKYPYEECLFFFELKLPSEEGRQYPFVPPIVLHKTAGIINYRLHPNLYGYRNFTVGGIDEKTCLGILNTFGTPEWKGDMTIWSVLGAMQALFMENPGMSEPGWQHLHNAGSEGVLYNTHVLYESIDITAKVYDMVIKSLKNTSTTNAIAFTNANVAAEGIPPYVKPFLANLARRAYSALTFLIGKLELFMEANGNKQVLHLPAYTTHHAAKDADFGALIARMKATRTRIPAALKVNVFTSGIGETHRALYEFSRPTWPNGKPKTYEEFAEELEHLEAAKVKSTPRSSAAASALGAGAGEEEEEEETEANADEGNTTQYIYDPNNNIPLEQPAEGEEI